MFFCRNAIRGDWTHIFKGRFSPTVHESNAALLWDLVEFPLGLEAKAWLKDPRCWQNHGFCQ